MVSGEYVEINILGNGKCIVWCFCQEKISYAEIEMAFHADNVRPARLDFFFYGCKMPGKKLRLGGRSLVHHC